MAKSTKPATAVAAEKAATEKVATEKAPKVQRINRAVAANRVVAALSGKTTLSELAAKADALFVEHGGESSVEAQVGKVRRALEAAEAFGVVRLTRPTDILVERI